MNSNWKLDISKINILPSKSPFNKSRTDFENGLPIFPARIGSHSFVGGGYRVVQDVPPFIIAAGEPLRFGGINKIGLQRRGFSDEKRLLIKKAYRTYFVSKINRTDALNKIKSELPATDEIKEIVQFIENSERGII